MCCAEAGTRVVFESGWGGETSVGLVEELITSDGRLLKK
jgi:hypothetical protein